MATVYSVLLQRKHSPMPVNKEHSGMPYVLPVLLAAILKALRRLLACQDPA
jgi:hypothetical protein